MNASQRLYAYLRQGPSITMTARQRRRFRRKLFKQQTAIMMQAAGVAR